MDVNPYAVAIARFRLLVAALQASGITRLWRVSDLRVPVRLVEKQHCTSYLRHTLITRLRMLCEPVTNWGQRAIREVWSERCQWDHTWGNMLMADAAEKWAAQSLYDIETAKAMLDSGRYLYVLFCCQQAVEKMLKALIAKRTRELPPRLHNLIRLAEVAALRFRKTQRISSGD